MLLHVQPLLEEGDDPENFGCTIAGVKLGSGEAGLANVPFENGATFSIIGPDEKVVPKDAVILGPDEKAVPKDTTILGPNEKAVPKDAVIQPPA